MGVPLSAGNFQNISAPGLRKVFFTDYYSLVSRESTSQRLYTFMNSKMANEYTLSMSTLGDFTNFTTTGQIVFDEISEGYKQTFTHEEWTGGFTITKKLARDDLYKATKTLPGQRAKSAFTTREKHGMSIFNGAFAGTGGADSLPLCSTAHTSTVSGISTQGNSGTETFSKTSVAATRLLMMKFYGLSGEDIGIELNEVLVPIDKYQDAIELVKTPKEIGTANNTINFFQGIYDVHQSRYLSSTYNWFAMDKRIRKESLLWFDNENLQLMEDFTLGPLVKAFAGYMRYSYGWSDWPWIYGHNASS